ncbi:MAG TPA: energy transducer TonB, partial [Candidatus Acidoferrales bacterium]|nr:energy transducer TonB [Candidatus Acidoferrales bacterium]
LTQVDNQVRASTGAGSITAWFVPNAKLQNASELQSGQGDILVYVPRNVALTIDATVESPGDHRIEADSTLPLKVKYVNTAAGRTLHGECAINGGGEVLHLKTISGNIRLRSADAMLARQQALIDQQYRQQMVIFQQQLRRLTEEDPDQIRQQMAQAIADLKRAQDMARATTIQQWTAQMPATSALAPQAGTPAMAAAPATTPAPETWPATTPQPPESGTADVWWMKLNEIWYGGVRVDYDEQQRRILRPVAQPAYPEVAREAGIEGTVEMRVTIDEQGKVIDIRLLSGEPALVQAAMNAVRQWRYRPYLVDRKPAKVVTVIRLEFKLQ